MDGKGRGSLLDLMKKKAEQDRAQASRSEGYSSQSTTSSSSSGAGRGRAQLVTLFKSKSGSDSESKDSSLTAGHGRGSIGGVLKKIGIEAYCNYVDLELEPGKGLFQYEVKFSPDIDSTGLRRKLLNQHSAVLGRTKTFDGMLLYLPIKLPEDVTRYNSTHPMDSSTVVLTVIFKKKQSMSENVQFFNILFNRIMRALSLVRIGRQNFNPQCAHPLERHRLEVWPGYVTAVNEYEGGLKLCLDARHRVMRTETIRDVIREIYQRSQYDYKDNVMKAIIGSSVLTRYNNRTYRIDDIAWDKTPMYEFSKDDKNMTLIEYYESNWNIEIEDKQQPLLVHRGTFRTPTGEKEERIILLVPELSYASGLTDDIRNNYNTMRDLNAVTKMSPNQRRDFMKRFIEEVEKNEVTRAILAEWGLRLSKELVQFPARCLDPETIIFGNNRTYRSFEKPVDWGGFAVRNPVLRTPNLERWHILYCPKDETCVRDFLETLKKISKDICMQIHKPQQICLPNDKTETYLKQIRTSISNDVEMIVIVFPTNRTDRYSAVKKLCCVQSAVASQVIIAKTISKPPKLKSVTEKIALQINCKLGGALWTLTMPLHNNCTPDRIIIFRDGVGDGDLDYVENYEVKQLLATFSRIAPNYKPQLSVIIVQKRINTRIFIKGRGRDDLANPPPGTVIDSCVTRRNYYDFFLVSQNVREGTVTPTHYVVIHDSSNMETDHMQRLTYKLCHLYYNWPGTIRVPAPCQYAHKLVYLVGQNLLAEPHQTFSNTLFYL
ncbi:hypothetical protein PUN28_005374 [Cardiocondyla obscurior]|uniref:Uncharacterized protein n=1 Tax=Cardiocondyla obscurior TaxID=286306 RepID=A0AAW2GJG8_9HYME